MSLGVLGDVTFEVSADKVRTWHDMRRAGQARWATHDVYHGPPVREFLGPGLNRLTFSVRFDMERGVVPADELAKLRDMRDNGIVSQFTVGPELIGDFTVESLDEELRRFSRTGVLLTAIVAITLEEYK